jgi:hypothetical protein
MIIITVPVIILLLLSLLNKAGADEGQTWNAGISPSTDVTP